MSYCLQCKDNTSRNRNVRICPQMSLFVRICLYFRRLKLGSLPEFLYLYRVETHNKIKFFDYELRNPSLQ